MFNAKIVQEWLETNERSKNWLARKTQLDRMTVYRALDGKRPSIETVAAIARVTGLSLDDLIMKEEAA